MREWFSCHISWEKGEVGSPMLGQSSCILPPTSFSLAEASGLAYVCAAHALGCLDAQLQPLPVPRMEQLACSSCPTPQLCLGK